MNELPAGVLGLRLRSKIRQGNFCERPKNNEAYSWEWGICRKPISRLTCFTVGLGKQFVRVYDVI